MIAEAVARHEKPITLVALAAVAAGAFLLMTHTGDVLMMDQPLGPVVFGVFMFAMWWTMMLAMMLPSAAPAILLFGAISRKQATAEPVVPAIAFSTGYAIVWALFSLAAVILQLVLQQFVFFDGMMEAHSAVLGGVLLIAAGAYQFSPWKDACLRHCQSPLFYLAHHWRKGTTGALRMGIEHGAYCAGCCAVLMGLLFYGGVMDLWWIVGLALYVLAEKLIFKGPILSRLSGAALIAWGGVVLATTVTG